MGGQTWSRASHGRRFVRRRTGPSRSGSARRAPPRRALAAVNQLWIETLTATQRAAWAVYADNVPVEDSLGHEHDLTGHQWFCGANAFRSALQIALALDAPTTFDRYTDFAPTFEALGAYPVPFRMGFPTNPWWAETGGALVVFQSAPQNPGTTHTPRCFRHFATVPGAPGGGPSSPKIFDSVWSTYPGQRIVFRYYYCRADGRYGSPAFVDQLIT